uniref:C-type lectin domain-containing protein n=1 Tax=Terrapene triunguis TaxID=2587831 RepID=A0A674JXI6_9SAUR
MFPVFLLDSPASAPPWKIIAVILGIFCLILLGVSVALAIKHHSCPGCPDQWVRYRDSCYYFSNVKRDWNSSRNFCSGSQFLKIDSKEELVKYILSWPGAPSSGWTPRPFKLPPEPCCWSPGIATSNKGNS